MSETVVANSATALAVSSPSEADYQFDVACRNAATRTAKGATRERQMLNRQKLIAAICADYRAHFAAVYGKSERLPSNVFEHIEAEADKYLIGQMKAVNVQNIIGMRRGFHHDSKQAMVTERVTLTGENFLALQEQHLGITIFITQLERRLDDVMRKKTPDYDLEKRIKQQLAQCNYTKTFVEGEIAKQKELKK